MKMIKDLDAKLPIVLGILFYTKYHYMPRLANRREY